MNIYRVENKFGKGCYRDRYNPIIGQMTCEHGNSLDTHPEPIGDKGIQREMKKKEICGFINLKQAKAWFTRKELTALGGEGYFLQKVKVKKITAIGEKQLLACR